MNRLNFVHLLTPVASGLVFDWCVSSLPGHTRGSDSLPCAEAVAGVNSLSEQSPRATGIFCWWHLKVQKGQERLNHGVFRRIMKWPVVCWACVLG